MEGLACKLSELRVRMSCVGLKLFRLLLNMGVSENGGTLFWGPYNKDPTI